MAEHTEDKVGHPGFMKELLPRDSISSSDGRIRNSRDQQLRMIKLSFYIPVYPLMSRKVFARIRLVEISGEHMRKS
jgi:hypothetical protein